MLLLKGEHVSEGQKSYCSKGASLTAGDAALKISVCETQVLPALEKDTEGKDPKLGQTVGQPLTG
ncbi:hypothetical protein [Microbulbifer sp. JMSA003]|uniref:hypothetical protein n=1 Tax=Microbulbifer sp. JMSA003 TaxID=3243369 RepID=UPI004039D584